MSLLPNVDEQIGVTIVGGGSLMNVPQRRISVHHQNHTINYDQLDHLDDEDRDFFQDTTTTTGTTTTTATTTLTDISCSSSSSSSSSLSTIIPSSITISSTINTTTTNNIINSVDEDHDHLDGDVGLEEDVFDVNVKQQHQQMNKCLIINEKQQRRHHHPQSNHHLQQEQENFYIEELAALISAGNFNEMNSLSVKPDKCAILQETVKQIQNINKQNDLQASEVSSSRPNILPPDLNSLLLDALNCFLFTLNADGYVEYISENVSQYLKFTQSEVINKSIFDILHPDDHPRFNALLLPMAIGNGKSNSNCWPSSSSLVDQMNTSSSSSSTNTSTSTTNSSSTTTNSSSSSSSANTNTNSLHNNSSPQSNTVACATGSSGSTAPSGSAGSSSAQFASSVSNDNNNNATSNAACSGSSSSSSLSSTSTSSSSLIGTLASLNNSSSHNEFNSFNSRFLVKTENSSNENEDDDDDDDDDFEDTLNEDDNLPGGNGASGVDDDLLDSLNFGDNEALANNDSSVLDSDLAAVLDAASQAESSSSKDYHHHHQQSFLDDKRKRLLLLKQKKQKQRFKQSSLASSLSSLPQYELMQVNTRFISNTESKQIDTLTTINSLNRSTSGSGGTSGSGSVHLSDCSSSHHVLHHHHQMTEESRVLCVARRLPDNEQTIGGGGQTNFQVEHFSTRLDFHGRVTGIDVSGMSSNVFRQINFLRNNLINNLLHDFVHPDDLKNIQQHLKMAIINGASQAATSKLYRLKVGPDQYAKVSTKTKLIKNGAMMAKHSIFFELAVNNTVKKEEDGETTTNSNNTSGGGSTGQMSTSMGSTNSQQQSSTTSLSNNDSSSHLQQSSLNIASCSSSSTSLLTTNSSSSSNHMTMNPMVSQWSNPIQQSQPPPDPLIQIQQPANNPNLNNVVCSSSSYNNSTTSVVASSSSSTTAVVAATIDFAMDDLEDMFQTSGWDFQDPASSSSQQQQEEPTTTVESLCLSSSSTSSTNHPHQVYTTVPFNSMSSSMMMMNSNQQQSSPMMISSTPSMFSTNQNNVTVSSIATIGSHQQQNMLMTTTTSGGTENKMDDKLRNLLTTGNSGTEDSDFTTNNNNNLSQQQKKVVSTIGISNNSNSSDILRELLDTEDDDEMIVGDMNNTDLESSLAGQSVCGVPTTSIGSSSTFDLLSGTDSKIKTMIPSTSSSSSSSNNMLRMLLNDDDCLKSSTTGQRNKMSSNSNDALAEHFLKDEPLNTNNNNSQKHMLDLNSLLSTATTTTAEDSSLMDHYFNNKRKASFDQQDNFLQEDCKRMATTAATSSSQSNTMSTLSGGSSSQQQVSGSSHQLLACQNPMLASMLAKTPTSLPEEKIQTIPPSLISSTPDVKLPPNLDKKILPTPNLNQTQHPHHLTHNIQQHQITLMNQTNLMNIQTQQQQQNQPHSQQIQNIQLQLQQQTHHVQQSQPQHHLVTNAIGPGSSLPTHVAIKSGQIHPNQLQQQPQQQQPQQQQQQQMKQQQVAQIAGGNFQRLQQLRQQQAQSNNQDLQLLQQQQLQQQPVLQPQVPMSVGQQLVHHQQQQQQLQQLKQQQQQQQQVGGGQQHANFLTQILTTSSPTGSMNISGQISKARVFATLTTNRQVNLSMLRNVAKVGTTSAATVQQTQQTNLSQQPMSQQQQSQTVGIGHQQQFINTLSGQMQMTPTPQPQQIIGHQSAQQQPTTNIMASPAQQISTQVTTATTSTNHLSPGIMSNESIDLEDPALSQILDEVIEMQDITSITMIGPLSSTSTVSNNHSHVVVGGGGSGVGGINQPSLSSLLSNTQNTANRRAPNDGVDLAALGLDSLSGGNSSSSSTSTLIHHSANEQQAISEIRKELMKVESFEQIKQNQPNNVNNSTNQSNQMFNSQPPTPQSPMLNVPPPLQQASPQGPPPNYQNSIAPPSYPQSTTTFNNSQISNSNLNRMPQSQQAAMSMQRGGMNPRGQQAVMQRVAAIAQASQQTNTYLVGQTTTTTGSLIQQQQQIQLVRIPKAATQSAVGQPQQAPPNLNVAHKRLLMHQEQQDFNVKPQMQNQPSDGSFDINGLNSINNTVAPNVQITVKPRQTTTAIIGQQQQVSTAQDSAAQMSPRYATAVVGNNAAMQVPSTPVLPQSPAPGSQLSPQGNPVSSAAVLRGTSYNHNATVYASPQTTLAASSGGGAGTGGQAPSPFSNTNRMSPGHFVSNSNVPTPSGIGHTSASASPSPAPPVSPLVQQISSPQSGNNGQPITQINWQQQASPSTSNRMSTNLPSPAQVMSPSSTSTPTIPQSNSPVTPNLVSIQQQSNPMLNAQLSGVGLQPRFQRPTRLPSGAQQGPRLVTLRQTGQFAMQTTVQNNNGDQQQFINHGNQNQQSQMTVQNMQHLLQQQQRGQVGQQRMMLQVNRMALQQQQQQFQPQHQIQQQNQSMTNSFTINTQTNVKLQIQSQQQITTNVIENNAFVGGTSNTSPGQHIFAQQPSSQVSIQSQQLNLNDLANFDQPSPSISQQPFNLDFVNATGTLSKNITSDFVKQKLNSFVSERSVQQQQQQQNQMILQQSHPTSQQIIQQQSTPPQTNSSMTTSTLDSPIYLDFEDPFFDTFDTSSNHSMTNSANNCINMGVSGGVVNVGSMGQPNTSNTTTSNIGLNRANSMDNQRPNSESLLQRLLSENS